MSDCWEDYRHRQRLSKTIFYLAPVVGIAALALGEVWGWTFSKVAFLTYAAVFFLVHCWFVFWRCPQCRRPFHVLNLLHHDLRGKKCVHCGLQQGDVPVGEQNGEAESKKE
jgi:hypothetical protein